MIRHPHSFIFLTFGGLRERGKGQNVLLRLLLLLCCIVEKGSTYTQLKKCLTETRELQGLLGGDSLGHLHAYDDGVSHSSGDIIGRRGKARIHDRGGFGSHCENHAEVKTSETNDTSANETGHNNTGDLSPRKGGRILRG